LRPYTLHLGMLQRTILQRMNTTTKECYNKRCYEGML